MGRVGNNGYIRSGAFHKGTGQDFLLELDFFFFLKKAMSVGFLNIIFMNNKRVK